MELQQFVIVEKGRLHTLHPELPVMEAALFNANGTPYTGRDEDFAPITVATAIGTAAKTTTAAEPEANTIVPIKFTNGNSAATPTIAFAGGAARDCLLGGTPSAAAKLALAANGVAFFLFDGTALHQIGAYT